jgi:hypothetical protein
VISLLFTGVYSEEDSFPRALITTCDVMPLLAADLNSHPSLVSCSSSSKYKCEAINCQVTSNRDKLELKLLPCRQPPAIRITNHALSGEMLYQDIFDASRLAVANIGGSKDVTLNVTIAQRGMTLGFGVRASP